MCESRFKEPQGLQKTRRQPRHTYHFTSTLSKLFLLVKSPAMGCMPSREITVYRRSKGGQVRLTRPAHGSLPLKEKVFRYLDGNDKKKKKKNINNKKKKKGRNHLAFDV